MALAAFQTRPQMTADNHATCLYTSRSSTNHHCHHHRHRHRHLHLHHHPYQDLDYIAGQASFVCTFCVHPYITVVIIPVMMMIFYLLACPLFPRGDGGTGLGGGRTRTLTTVSLMKQNSITCCLHSEVTNILIQIKAKFGWNQVR